MTKRIYLLVFIALSCTYCSAQLCFNKSSNSDCSTKLIFEYGLSYPIELSDPSRDHLTYAFYNLGVLKKMTKKSWVGGYFFADVFQCAPQFGLSARYSYFPHDNIELSISPGIILSRGYQSESRDFYNLPGFNIETSIMYKNHIGLSARMDFLNHADGQKRRTLNIGIKTGGLKAVFIGIPMMLFSTWIGAPCFSI